jgi:hypothetical protein
MTNTQLLETPFDFKAFMRTLSFFDMATNTPEEFWMNEDADLHTKLEGDKIKIMDYSDLETEKVRYVDTPKNLKEAFDNFIPALWPDLGPLSGEEIQDYIDGYKEEYLPTLPALDLYIPKTLPGSPFFIITNDEAKDLYKLLYFNPVCGKEDFIDKLTLHISQTDPAFIEKQYEELKKEN